MPTHSSSRRRTRSTVFRSPWSLSLRAVIALATALLTLPVLDAPASADAVVQGADVTTTTPAQSGDPAAGPVTDPAPTDPGATGATSDAASSPPSGAADPQPATGLTPVGGTSSSGSGQAGTAPQTSGPPRRALRTVQSLQAPVPALAPPLAAPLSDTGGFEIDGDTAVDNGGQDWDAFGAPGDDLFADSDFTNFKGTSKEFANPSDPPSAGGWVDGTPPTTPGKTDIGKVYTHNTTYGGDVWSFFGFTRRATNGTTAYDVEYNQKKNLTDDPPRPDRTPGDLLVQLAQQGSPGTKFDVQQAYLWTLQSDSAWNDKCIAVPSYSPAAGWCPDKVPAGAFTGATGDSGFFAEGALDISKLFGPGTCRGDFGVINIRSRSSDSGDSALSDWVAPIGVSIPGNCAKIVIAKQDLDGNPVGGATFTISPDPTPGVSGGTLSVTDNQGADQDPAAGVVKIDPVEPDSYTVTETGAPPGYFLPKDRSIGPRALDAGTPARTYTFTFQDPKRWQDLTATKTATATYDASYAWALDKKVNSHEQHVPQGTPASFAYDVEVTQGARTTSAWKVAGTVSVTNPNAAPMVATLSDAVADGGSCTFAAADVSADPGLQVSVPAGTTGYDYLCTYASEPATLGSGGTNTASVTWSRAAYPKTQGDVDNPGSAGIGTAAATAGYTWQVVHEANKTVTVTDTQHTFDPAWTVTWSAEGTKTSKSYSRSIDGVAGECHDYPNTASLLGDGGKTVDSDTETVKVCVGLDLAVSKNVVSSLTRTYDWSITKKADRTEVTVDPSTGKATATYTVTVKAQPSRDSQWTMSGVISVTNPNHWEGVTLSALTDVYDGGGTCTVTDFGDGVVAGDSTRQFHYTCEFGDTQPAYDGTNVATATWGPQLYATPHGSASGSVGVVEADWNKTSVDQTVTVVDDKTVSGESHTLGTATWSPGLSKDFTYSLQLEGAPGDCRSYTNTASIEELPTREASATVRVCWPLDVSVSKTAAGTYHRDYRWDLQKTVEETRHTISGGTATFHYTVTATPDGYVDSGWAMGGTITVSNPNLFQTVTVDLTDTPNVGGGATCTVTDGTGVVVPVAHENQAGGVMPGTATRDYTCTVPNQPTRYSEGTNIATASHDGTSVDSPAVTVPFTLPEANKSHETVHVTDDRTTGAQAPLGTADWGDGPQTFRYTVEQAGVAGQCTTYDNEARITETEQSATASAELCVQSPLVVTKQAYASYDRTYHWLVDKSVDQTSVDVGPDGQATFHYTVTATPDGYTDGSWQLHGTVTVRNPNGPGLAPITADVTDVPSGVGGGAACTVPGGDQVTLASGEETTLPYACTFTGQPSYSGGSNTAYATWQGPEDTQRVADGSAPVEFGVAQQTDRTVTVTDDKVTLETPAVLGTATWDEGPATFGYDLTLPGKSGTCVDYTNTAVVESGQGPEVPSLVAGEAGVRLAQDQQTVTVCRQGDLTVVDTNQAGYTRSYAWSIDKAAGKSRYDVSGDHAAVDYTVRATPGAATDSGWTMTGSVTVANPNDYKDVAVAVTKTTDLGSNVSCVLDDGQDLTVPRGGSATYTYTCTFAGAPDALAGTDGTTVSWAGGHVDLATPVTFALGQETDKVVDVVDDQTVPGQSHSLGQAAWNADGTPVEFGYSLDLPAPADCADYTNTATLVQTEQSAQATVRVCGPAVLGVEAFRPHPRPPVVKGVEAALPATGAPADTGWLLAGGGLAVVLGAWLALRGRRLAR